MSSFFKSNALIVYIISLALAIASYIYVQESYALLQLQIIRLTQLFAFIAVGFLYLYLLIDPLSFLIKENKFLNLWKSLQKEFITSTLFFGILHSSYAFFGQLGGFPGLLFLSDYYLVGITTSFTGLLLITLGVVLIFNKLNHILSLNKGDFINRLLYISGLLVLFHALLLGTHFHDLSEVIPFIIFIAVSFLFLLNAMRWEQVFSKSVAFIPRFGILSVLVFLLMFVVYFWYINPQSGNDSSSPLSVHSQHINSYEDISTTLSNQNSLYMPGMEGDKSKRFNVDLFYPTPIVANKNVELDFKITDASNGEPIYFFQTPFEKPFHLIAVNSDLSYFSHIHPFQEKNNFVIETSFPSDDTYRLYSDFQPFGAVEQQYGFQINVGESEEIVTKQPTVNLSLDKQVDQYKVQLSFDQPLTSEQLNNGTQQLRFSIFDQNSNPVTNLFPYLGAFGHLVMIKKDTYEYIHAHPVMTKPVTASERSGPTVAFVPMALYSKITPGIYKVFGQFKPNDMLITADFWIEVK